MNNEIKKLINDFGLIDYSINKLIGDGSDRSIFRIEKVNAKSYIAVYGNLIPENKAFLKFRKIFEDNRFNVPKLYAVSNNETAYLLEDLGNQTVDIFCKNNLTNKQLKKIEEIYLRIILELPKLQISLKDKIDYKYCYQHSNFDFDNIIFDTNRFQTYFLQKFINLDYDKKSFRNNLNRFANKALNTDNDFFVYRDFQTRNMMLKNGKLFFIDFQSGRKGSLFYDLASFLYDSDTYMTPIMEDFLINTYITQLKKEYNLNFEIKEFKEKLYQFGVIRVFQAIGAYGYLTLVKGKKNYIQKIPAAFSTLTMLLKRLKNDDFFDESEIKKIYDEINNVK